MHELSICEALLDTIAGARAERGFRRVSRVRLEIGAFSCLDAEALRFAFDVISRQTLAEGAALEIDQPPGQAVCLDCGAAVEVESRLARCPACGGERLNPTGGDRMRLVEMDVL